MKGIIVSLVVLACVAVVLGQEDRAGKSRDIEGRKFKKKLATLQILASIYINIV